MPKSTNGANLSTLIFSADDVKNLFAEYQGCTLDVLSATKGYDDIVISERAFASAVSECSKDLSMLASRRLPNGISDGKVAGVFAFRLSRWNIISLPEGLADDPAMIQLNYLAALAFTYRYLGISPCKILDKVRIEIQYNLVRRHSNQETLGLCFDMLLSARSSTLFTKTTV